MSKTAENIKLFLSGVGNGFNAAIQDFLTVRECEILKLIAAGKTSRQIADELFISKNTVDTHRNKMLQKLNLTNTASLVGYACSAGLI
ncbi:helix-turn-helix domain-containing protein [Limisalsivibrio acetivorans]|uniref:helix-turn-helix domain-containing protein n=1 Tax=Limisalsivibrio acetivorans TaxID=1304888 RepID=UPI00041357BA|nr:helix-turn-helix transcriptional regulator [Limisalsivibrio acetivorans]